MIRVGVDVDGVLRDFSGAVHGAFLRHRPDVVTGECSTDYIGFNNIDLPDSEKRRLIFGEWAEEIYLGADAVAGSLPKFLELCRWIGARGGVVDCVTKNKGQFAEMTMRWLEANHFRFHEYFFTGDKHKIGLDYLIDDSPLNWKQWNDSSVNVEGGFILMDSPYNQNINASNRVADLGEALAVIERMEG